MEFIGFVIDVVMHIDKYLNVVIQNYGVWVYVLLFLIIFAETGLVVTPFLPGDSLLFAVGAFAALESFELPWLLSTLVAAAVIGDSVNYAIGKYFGERLFRRKNSRIFKREYLEKTHKFYEKHGKKTIVLARFVPVVRTFAPFVAGLGKMCYRDFFFYNVTGGILWVVVLVLVGYYFGNVPIVKDNFSIAIFAIVFISCLPIVIEFWRHRIKRKDKKV
jgi:membrane-associated protein